MEAPETKLYIPRGEQEEYPSNRHMLFVSLYMMLLAFFILLNSISLQDNQRSEDALGSLSSAFSSGEGKKLPTIRVERAAGAEQVINNYFAGVERIAQNALELIEVEKSPGRGVMRIVIPKYRLFEYGEVKLKSGQKELFERIADVVSSPPQGARTEVAVIMTMFKPQEIDKEAAKDPDIRRASLIAHLLQKHSAPAQNIAVSLQEANKELAILTFSIHPDDVSLQEIITE